MSLDPHLSEILLNWEDARARGQDLSAEELCRAFPELMPQVEEGIRALRAMTPVLDLTSFGEDATSPVTAHGPVPLDAGSLPGFSLLAELGRGGAGVVYQARQTALDRLVAIKMLMGGTFAGEVALARFRSEARTLAQLRDPHIVQIHDIGSYQGSPYFVLEFLDGGSLAELAASGPADPDESARLLEVIARTVHKLHCAGIVHRDLKPGNVLLQRLGPDVKEPPPGAVELRGQWVLPKLTDFGLARAVEDERHLTSTGMIIGTPAYMAPEQAQGNKAAIGPAADIYSLGVLLYQLLTGTLPFEAEASWQLMQQIIIKVPEPPRRRRPDCPAGLEAICLCCMQKKPGDRYASAEALADDLQRYLRGERPLAAVSRRRRPWRVLVSAGLGIMVLIAVVLWWQLASSDEPPPRNASGVPLSTARPPPRSLVKEARSIGVLVNISGRRARADEAIIDGVQLAVDELNARGENVVVDKEDGALTSDGVVALARRLITQKKVAVLIGCATPEDRKEIQPLLDEMRQLLLVPVRSETIAPGGRMLCLEPPLIDYARWLAAWANRDESRQKMLWVDDEMPVNMALGKELGSALGRLERRPSFEARHVVEEFDWSVFGRDFLDPEKRPNVVIGCVHDQEFFRVFNAFRPPDPPRLMFLDLSEQDKKWFVKRQELNGIHVLSTWLLTHRTRTAPFYTRLRENVEMLKRANAATASAYAAVHLWHQAAKAAKTMEPDRVRAALDGQRFDGLGTTVSINGSSGHATRELMHRVMDASGNVNE
jgi:serine/threonine protein kinase/ABC-type branched-subunit amino acid transport system substrate-binding protein